MNTLGIIVLVIIVLALIWQVIKPRKVCVDKCKDILPTPKAVITTMPSKLPAVQAPVKTVAKKVVAKKTKKKTVTKKKVK